MIPAYPRTYSSVLDAGLVGGSLELLDVVPPTWSAELAGDRFLRLHRDAPRGPVDLLDELDQLLQEMADELGLLGEVEALLLSRGRAAGAEILARRS